MGYKYAVIEEDNIIARWGDVNIPAEQFPEFLARNTATALTEEEFAQLRVGTRYRYIGGVIEEIGDPLTTLEEFREWALKYVDNAAEQARLLHITGGSGQAAVYILKRDEANRFNSIYTNPELAEEADPDDWPMIAAEVGITAPTLYETAVIIMNVANNYVQMAARIENIRLGAKKLITDATTYDEIAQVIEDIVWPPLSP